MKKKTVRRIFKFLSTSLFLPKNVQKSAFFQRPIFCSNLNRFFLIRSYVTQNKMFNKTVRRILKILSTFEVTA